MSAELFPLGEAALPSNQMRVFQEISFAYGTWLAIQAHRDLPFDWAFSFAAALYAVVVFVALSSALYFAWSPALRTVSYLRDLDLVAAVCEVFPVLLGVACILLLLRQRACYEKIHERRM
nr:hypothetical protein TgIa.1120c [Toxoplasma gondii RH]